MRTTYLFSLLLTGWLLASVTTTAQTRIPADTIMAPPFPNAYGYMAKRPLTVISYDSVQAKAAAARKTRRVFVAVTLPPATNMTEERKK